MTAQEMNLRLAQWDTQRRARRYAWRGTSKRTARSGGGSHLGQRAMSGKGVVPCVYPAVVPGARL